MSDSDRFSTFHSTGAQLFLHDLPYLGGWQLVLPHDQIADACLFLVLMSPNSNPTQHLTFAYLRNDGYIVALSNRDTIAQEPQQRLCLTLTNAHTHKNLMLSDLIPSDSPISHPIICTLRVDEPEDGEHTPAAADLQSAQYQATFDPDTHLLTGDLGTHHLPNETQIEDLCAHLVYAYYLFHEHGALSLALPAFMDIAKHFDPLAEARRLKHLMQSNSADDPFIPQDLYLDFSHVLRIFEPARRTHELWTDLAELSKRARTADPNCVSEVLTYALVQYDELFGVCIPEHLPILRAQGHGIMQPVDNLIEKDTIEQDVVTYDYLSMYRPDDEEKKPDENEQMELSGLQSLQENQTFMDHTVRLMSRQVTSNEDHLMSLETLDLRDTTQEEADQLASRYMRFVVRLNALHSCLAQRFGDTSPQATYPSLALLSEVDQELEAIEVHTMFAQHEEGGFSPVMTIPATKFATPSGVFYNIWEHLEELNIEAKNLSTRTLGLVQEIARLQPQLINESLPVVICSTNPSYAQLHLTVFGDAPLPRSYCAREGWLNPQRRSQAALTVGYRHAFIYAYQILRHNKAVNTVQVYIEEKPDVISHYIAKEQAKRYTTEALMGIEEASFKVEVVHPEHDFGAHENKPRTVDTLIITRSILDRAVQACLQAPERSQIDKILMDQLQQARTTVDATTDRASHSYVDDDPADIHRTAATASDGQSRSETANSNTAPLQGGSDLNGVDPHQITHQTSGGDDGASAKKLEADVQASAKELKERAQASAAPCDTQSHDQIASSQEGVDLEKHHALHQPCSFPYVPLHSTWSNSEYLYESPVIPWLLLTRHLAEQEGQGLLPALDACTSTQERVRVLLDAQKAVQDNIIGELLQSTIDALIAGSFETESSQEIYEHLAFTKRLNKEVGHLIDLIYQQQFDECLNRCRPLVQLILDRFSLEDTEAHIWRSFKSAVDAILYQCNIAKPDAKIFTIPRICIDYLSIYVTLLLRTHQDDQARLHLEQLVRIAPADVDNILRLAYLYEQNQELSAMQQLLVDHIPYIHSSDGAGICYYRLAFAFYKQGLQDSAIAAYLMSTALTNRSRYAAISELMQLFDPKDIHRIQAQLSPEKLQELGIPLMPTHLHRVDLLILAHRLIARSQFAGAAQVLEDLNGTYRSSTLSLLSQTHLLTEQMGAEEPSMYDQI